MSKDHPTPLNGQFKPKLVETDAPPRPPDPPRGRPFGKFRIAAHLLNTEWRNLLPLSSGIVVVRASFDYATNCVEVVALCDAFELVPPSTEPPFYNVTRIETEAGVRFDFQPAAIDDLRPLNW